MSKADKLREKLLSQPKDFSWNELKQLLSVFGFRENSVGKTSGSRVRFIHGVYEPILLHKPHPKTILRQYQLKQIIAQLTREGLL